MTARRRARVLGLVVCALVSAGCRERAARFMGVDASAPLPTSPAEDENEVHFSFTGPTSVTFSWRGSGRTVRLWSKDAPPREIEAHEPVPVPFSAPGPWKEATITGLLPGSEYGYEIGRPRFPVPAFFRTPPVRGTAAYTFTFVAVAGIGASIDFPEVSELHRLIALEDPAFVLALGDLTFADIRSQASVDAHFNDVMAWSRKAAYLPVWGEHEWRTQTRDDLRNYKGRFALPNGQAAEGAPAAGCCGDDWFWFDYGNARFISYPEPYTDATWEDWAAKAGPLFDAAERDTQIAFVITAGHRTAFSSGPDAGDSRLRRMLDGFGARSRKYVLDLSGHGGAYERTKAVAHVVHIVTGTGAGELDHAETSCFWPECAPPDFMAFRAIHHAFLKLSVRPTALRIEAFCGATTPGRDDIHCTEGDIFDQTEIAAAPPR